MQYNFIKLKVQAGYLLEIFLASRDDEHVVISGITCGVFDIEIVTKFPNNDEAQAYINKLRDMPGVNKLHEGLAVRVHLNGKTISIHDKEEASEKMSEVCVQLN